QLAKIALDEIVAIAASPRVEIVFQVDRRTRRLLDRFDRALGENRAPQIRVKHDSDCVYDRPEGWKIALEIVLRVDDRSRDHRLAFRRHIARAGEDRI